MGALCQQILNELLAFPYWVIKSHAGSLSGTAKVIL
jgi:hypothetical protein